MESIDSLRKPERVDSFSFSCYDLNSGWTVFSEDDGNGSDNDDNESYIEIALENDDDDADGEAEVFELRISFSSQGLRDKKIQENAGFETDSTTETPSPSSTLSMSCSSTRDCSLGISSEVVEERFRASQTRQDFRDINHWELVKRRKTPKSTMAINDGIARFFIKFRAIKFRNLLASFAKPLQVISAPGNGEPKKKRSKGTIQSYQRLIKPFDKWMTQRNLGKGCSKNDSKNSSGFRENYSRVLEINLDPLRGVLEAVGMGVGRKDRQTRSCPNSVGSSPLHGSFPSESKFQTKENSIEAAIAHCKRSFGRTSDFSF